MRHRDPEAGITLVEMLVSLALFALVGLASFGVLDAVIRMRDATERRLDDVAAYDRALILFGRDLAQSRSGSHALAEGRLDFQREGRGGLAYVVAEGTLERWLGEDLPQPLVRGLERGGIRLLDAQGAWHEDWPAQESDASPLVAAELRLELPGVEIASLRRLVVLPLPASPAPVGSARTAESPAPAEGSGAAATATPPGPAAP